MPSRSLWSQTGAGDGSSLSFMAENVRSRDSAMTMQFSICSRRWVLTGPLNPMAACFKHAVPLSLAVYNEAFQSPLHFDASFSGFQLANEDLARKLPTAIPELAELHDRIAGQALSKLIRAETSHRARDVIARRLQDGSPLRSTIAAELHMSDHTFQRRLAAEGTSFSDLVDETRRELAQHHLSDPRATIAAITYLLGFADQSTFFRASQRWFGEAPGEYRRRVTERSQGEIAGAQRQPDIHRN
jgi:AraC-like DNA-binding protein